MATALLDRAKTYTPDDLLRIPDGHRFELVDGRLERRDMGTTSSWVGGELYARVRDFCQANRAGWVFAADAGYACFAGGRTVRFPDVSVIRFGRLPGEQLPEGHLTIPPDLAVEVVSPRDRVEKLERKLRDYRTAGVRLVWVIYPALGIARVHRPDRTITEIAADEFLDGEAVLPGFRVRLGDLFPPRPGSTAPAAQPQP